MTPEQNDYEKLNRDQMEAKKREKEKEQRNHKKVSGIKG